MLCVLTIAFVVMAMIITPGCSPRVALAQTDSPAESQAVPSGIVALEQAVFRQVNAHRARQHLPPLQWDERIARQARQHSRYMLRHGLSHAGFEQRLEAIGRVIPLAAAAENVAYNQGVSDPATHAVQGWLSSSDHRRNIEGPFTLTGVGAARNTRGEFTFTQIFLRPR